MSYLTENNISNNPQITTKSIHKNSSNKTPSESISQSENLDDTDKDINSIEKEVDPKTNNLVTNFIDSLFDEPAERKITKKEKFKNDQPYKHFDLKNKKLRNKTPRNIKKLNKTDTRVLNRYLKKNKNLFLDTEVIFNNFQQQIKINKKRFICEQKLKIINEQISFLLKEKIKLNKELSLLKIKENSLYNISREKMVKRKDDEEIREKSYKIGNKIEGNGKKEDDPENIIKLFNSNLDNNRDFLAFESNKINQNKENEIIFTSRSVVKDINKNEKKKMKDIKLNINISDLYNIKTTHYNSNIEYMHKDFNKNHMKTTPNRISKEYINSKEKQGKNIFYNDSKKKRSSHINGNKKY
jgi:hypothetical protein